MNRRLRDLTLVALFPAMLAATAGIYIPLGALPPVTLQTLFVLLSGLILGASLGALSMSIYVLLGVIGLPVFAGFNGGLGVVIGQNGGFLISFIVVSYFVGFMKNRKIINNDFWHLIVVLAIGSVLVYMIGASYLAFVTDSSYWLILAGMYVFFPGDLLKILVATYVYLRIRPHITYERS